MSEQATKSENVKKESRASKIFFGLSVIYSLLSFLFYIGLDAFKINRDGWTAANIVVTGFLAAQIVIYAVFLAAGATKKQKKTYKAGKKSLKIAKKVVTKILALATSAAVIVSAGSDPGLLDIVALVVAALALAMAITEIIWRIVLFLIARKLKKTVRGKLGAEEGESLGSAAKARAKEYAAAAKEKLSGAKKEKKQ